MGKSVSIGIIFGLVGLLSGCGGTSDQKLDVDIELTKEMLEEKIFYENREVGGEESEYYGKSKYEFPKVLKIKMKECPCEGNPWLVDSYKQSIAIENGKLKVTTEYHGTVYVTLQKIEGNTWDVSCEQDEDNDGIIDQNGTGTWYTAEPEGYPEFPEFSTDMDEEELLDLALYSLFTCGF